VGPPNKPTTMHLCTNIPLTLGIRITMFEKVYYNSRLRNASYCGFSRLDRFSTATQYSPSPLFASTIRTIRLEGLVSFRAKDAARIK